MRNKVFEPSSNRQTVDDLSAGTMFKYINGDAYYMKVKNTVNTILNLASGEEYSRPGQGLVVVLNELLIKRDGA